MPPKDSKSLRSYRWYGPDDLRSFGHRSRAASMGCTQADYAGKPVIAIINTWGDINPCHSHLRERAEDVKKGIWQAGGFPVEMPAFTLGETFQKPTTMMYRNLLAMETEELLRSYPADGCVLMGGCDKTTPALLMGAISMNLPAIYVPAGPMLRGNWRGANSRQRLRRIEILGRAPRRQHRPASLDRNRRRHRALRRNLHDHGHRFHDDQPHRSPRASLSRARRSIPAVDANHPKMANRSGRRIVEMVWEDLKPRDILQRSVLQQRDRRRVRSRRLDERRNPPDRHGRPRGNQNHSRSLRSIFKKNAHARQHSPQRQISDGRFLLRRRIAALC